MRQYKFGLRADDMERTFVFAKDDGQILYNEIQNKVTLSRDKGAVRERHMLG